MRTGCIWAGIRWLLAMFCGMIVVLVLSRTCSFDPERESGRIGGDPAGVAPEVQRSYTPGEVPNPKNQGAWNWVSNPDGILSDETVTEINGLLTGLEDSLSIEVAVVVLNSIGDEVPREFACELFNLWRIGKSALDNGLLVQLILDRREVTFETGYGLEGILPDVICYRIQQQAMVPWLAEDDFDRGMLQGVWAVVEKLYGSDSGLEDSVGPESSWLRDMDSENWWVIGVFGVLIGLPNVFIFLWFCRQCRPKSKTAEAALNAITKRIFMGWKTALLFLFLPLWPAFLLCFLWYWLWQYWYLLRRSHVCPHCHKATLHRLSDSEVAARFSEAQCLENKLHSAIHRIYRCHLCREEMEYHQVLSGSYRECRKCHTLAQKRTGKWKTVRRATYSSGGLQQAEYQCLFCGEKIIVKRKTERLSRSSSGSGSSGSGGSSSGGHFGGGHSGGGGASSRF